MSTDDLEALMFVNDNADAFDVGHDDDDDDDEEDLPPVGPDDGDEEDDGGYFSLGEDAVQVAPVSSTSAGDAVKKEDTTVAISSTTPPAPAPISTSTVTLRSSTAAAANGSLIPNLATSSTVPSAVRSTSIKSKKKKSGSGSVASHASAAGENTGRWTAEEHRLFLQGLEQHGKGWKKIASLIKSRTVVQIRTHAQKYFQKLTKARQNGEEGDVTMEGRGGVASSVASIGSATAAAHHSKRRRQQVSGTKRKALQSVVASAMRQGKKLALQRSAHGGVPPPQPPLPALAPVLAHFVLPQFGPNGQPLNKNAANGGVSGPKKDGPTLASDVGAVSAQELEETLFRFLTPHPVLGESPAPPPPATVNDVARHAGANAINVPAERGGASTSITDPTALSPTSGEISPTGVTDLALYPSWIDGKDVPDFYKNGGDVDALLDVGDNLDWLADTGDLHETFQPPQHLMDDSLNKSLDISETKSKARITSVSSMPRVNSNMDSVVPPLPSIFDGSPEPALSSPDLKTEDPLSSSSHSPNLLPKLASSAQLQPSVSATNIDEHLQVFDSPLEEHDFVSTILEDHDEEDKPSAELPAMEH